MSQLHETIRDGRSAAEPGLRLLVTVTLNPNHIRSHLQPLVDLPEVESVTLVADNPAPTMPKLRSVVPSDLLVRLLGRAGAKLVVCLRLARSERPDWVVAYNIMPHGLNAFLVGKLTGTRTMFHLIGGTEEWEGGGWDSSNRYLSRLPRPVRMLERAFLVLLRRFDLIVTMGKNARQTLIERGARPERVHVIPASVDALKFTPSEHPTHDYDLLSVARLIPLKRLEDLIAAVGRLRAERPTIQAAIVGVGSLEDELRARVAEAGLEQAVHFLGFRLDIAEIYARSRVFVLCSAHEGLSVALSEAMASGLPAVVSDVGEVSDLVEDGRNGFRYPVGDVDRLVECLRPLLNDEGLRTRLGRAAAADARAVTGLAQATERYRTLLTRDR